MWKVPITVKPQNTCHTVIFCSQWCPIHLPCRLLRACECIVSDSLYRWQLTMWWIPWEAYFTQLIQMCLLATSARWNTLCVSSRTHIHAISSTHMTFAIYRTRFVLKFRISSCITNYYLMPAVGFNIIAHWLFPLPMPIFAA